MYDQNPLLHKLTIDDLAKAHLDVPSRRNQKLAKAASPKFAAALTVTLLLVIVVGTGGT